MTREESNDSPDSRGATVRMWIRTVTPAVGVAVQTMQLLCGRDGVWPLPWW